MPELRPALAPAPSAATAPPTGRAVVGWRAVGPLVLALLALFEVEWLDRTASSPYHWPPGATQAVLDASHDIAAAPLAWALNCALMLGLVWLLAAILGRLRRAAALLLVLLLLLGIAHRQKFQATGDPLFWWDLRFAIPVALALLKLVPRVYLVLASILGAVGIGWWWQSRPKCRAGRQTLRQRIVWACAGLALLLGTLALLVKPPHVLASTLVFPGGADAWAAPRTYQQRGLILCIAIQATQPAARPPANYSPAAVERICREQETPLAFPGPDAAPDVILWLSESFFDVTQLPGVRIIPDPLENFRQIAAEGSHGSLLVPVFAGMTACTEYEMLTGMSHRYTPYGVCEYREFINHPLPSVPRLFADHGYHTIAVSACTGNLFREPTVMPLLGFQEYLEDVPSAVQRGNWVSDASLTRFVIDTVEASPRPVFFLARSMQAHMPYTVAEYPSYDLTVEGAIPVDAARALRSYAQSIHEADQALRALVEHFRRSRRKVVIVFFGDHLPPLRAAYHATEFLQSRGASRAAMEIRQHTTPLLLWTNSAIQLPALPAHPVSPPIVMSRLLSSMGVRHPFYTGMLGKLAETAPAISSNVCVTADGEATLDLPKAPIVADYATLCYDVLLGERYSAGSIFADTPRK